MAKNKKKKTNKKEVEKQYGNGIAPISLNSNFNINTPTVETKKTTKKAKKETKKKKKEKETIKVSDLVKSVDPDTPIAQKYNTEEYNQYYNSLSNKQKAKENEKVAKQISKQKNTELNKSRTKANKELMPVLAQTLDEQFKRQNQLTFNPTAEDKTNLTENYGVTSEKSPYSKNYKKTEKEKASANVMSKYGIEAKENDVILADYLKNYYEQDNQEPTIAEKILSPVTQAGTLVTGIAKPLGYQQYQRKDGLKTYLPDKLDLNYEKTGEKIDSGLGKFIYEAGGEASKILASSGINAVAPGVGTGMYWTSMAGNNIAQARNKATEKGEKATGKVLLNAAAKTGLEYITGKFIGSATKGLTGGKASELEKVITDKVYDAKFLQSLSDSTKLKIAKLVGSGVSEGTEETIQDPLEKLIDILTFGDDGKHKNVKELVTDLETYKDALKAGAAGALTSGMVEGANMATNSSYYDQGAAEIEKNKRTKNEQKVIDTELQNRIATEFNGEATAKEIAQLQKEIIEDMEKGYVSTDTIEQTLGGKTYKELAKINQKKNNIQQEIDELQKKADNNELSSLEEKQKLADLKEEIKTIDDSEVRKQLNQEIQETIKNDISLQESYKEINRRSENYSVDLSKVENEKQRAVYQKAMDSGVLNNSNKTHALVDMIAKISSDKNIDFDFTNNEQLEKSGFGVNGRNINGYVTDSGITINLNSGKAINRIVGHELTHTFEGTTLYTELQDNLKDFLGSEWDNQVAKYKELYKGVKNANIENELTSDLIGDYLFTDENYVKNLSTKNKNLFEKVYDEIKYLYNVATAGSKEQRQLEKVKRTFDRIYNETESKVTTEDAKLSIEENAKSIQGLEDYTREEIKNITNDYIKQVLEDNGYDDIEIIDSDIHGSRNRGTAKANSDLDVVVQYNGDIREDDFFNMLNDNGDDNLYINGIKVDINPIKENLSDYMERSNEYDKKVLDKNVKYSVSEETGKLQENGKDVTLETTPIGNGTLMAMHNISEEKFNGVLDLGGIPVPSIAITNPNIVDHNQFGEGTLIFNKSTIDPVVKKNEVYDRDVWSPTFPRVEYEANKNTIKEIKEKLGLNDNNYQEQDSIQRKTELSLYQEHIENSLDSGDLDYLRDEMKNNKDMQYAYLKSKGEIEPIYKTKNYNDEVSNEALQEFLEKYQGSTGFSWSTELNDLDFDQTMELKDTIKNIVRPYIEEEYSKYGVDKDIIEKTISEYDNFNKLNKFINSAEKLNRNGMNAQEIDEYATLEKVGEILNKEEYNNWVDETFNENIINDKGIRNDKDIFTPQGNRRSFKQTHNPLNLETLVKALSRGNTKGGQEMSMFGSGFGRISAQQANRFNSIKDIKTNESRLMTDAQAKEISEPLSEKLYADAQELGKYYVDRESKSDFVTNMRAYDTTSQAIEEFAKKSLTKENLIKELDSWNSFDTKNIPDSVINNIIDDLNQIKNLPTDYFEAKPQRAVGLDEIEMAVIPNTWSNETKQRLTDNGISYTEYDPSIEGDRNKAVNQFDNLKFSLDIAPISKNFLTEAEQDELDGLRSVENSGWAELTPEEQSRMYELENKSDKVLNKKAEKMLRSASYKAINTTTKIAQNYLDFDAKQKKEFRSQMREFSNMTKDELVNADTYNKVKDIVSQYANKEYTYFDENVEGIKRELKHTKIQISDELKNQITDYGDFVKDSKLMLRRNSGQNVDTVYQEYSNMYPGFFDDSIMSEADQLEALNDFVNHDFSVTEKYKLTDEDLRNATDLIYNKLLDNSLTQQDLIETEEILDKKAQKRTRSVVREELLQKMGITPETIQVGNDISAISFARTDPIRVNEKVFGWETGQKINDATVNFTKHQEAERIRFLNKERQEIKDLGIKARSKESELVQKYGEKQYIDKNNEVHEYGDAELERDVQDAATREKIKNAARVLRQKYDTYIDRVNEVLTEMGYDEIPKRKDYMRHFVELDDKFSRWGLPFNKESMSAEDLPTDINGLTEFNRPGKSYFASANTRTGLQTTYDAITGIDGYLEGVSNLIYHTESIQRYRALTRLIRENFGREHGYDNMDLMTDEELADRIKDIQDNKLSKYVAWLDEQANSIAGKKGALDRSVERMFGRRIYTALNTLKSQVGSNMTGFNVRSAMTNFASAIQGASKTKKLALVKGTISTINNIINNDGLIDKSDFLTRRFGSDSLAMKPWQKLSKAGQVFMEGTDYFTANQIWRSKYFENLDKGMSETQAIKNADDFAARIMGDRSKGSTAELFNSKTLGFLSQFQLEVNNQWSSLIHDNKIDIQKGDKTALGVTFELGQLFAASYMFNTMMKALTGSDVMIDPIDMMKKIFFPDDDDKEDDIIKRAQKVLGEFINQLPFANLITGGGRIPISEAFTGVQTLGKKLMGGTDNYGNEIEWEDVGEDLKESLAYWLLPTGYGQIRKTAKGLSMYDDKLPIAGSYTKSGNLRFSAEDTPLGRVKAGLFGQYSSKYAQDYIKSGYKSINASKLDEMKDLDMNSTEYRKYRQGLSNAGSSVEDKLNYISDLNVSDEDKTIMASNVAKKDIDMSEYKKYGSYEEFNYAQKNPAKYEVMKLVGGYDTYKNYEKEINDIKADYDRNGKAITNSRKNKVIKYVNSLNLSAAQKAMLIKQEYPSFTKYDNQIASYINRQDISYIDKASILKQLGFTAYDRQIINYIKQNYRTVEEQQRELEKLGFKVYNYNGKTYVR